MKNAFSPCPTAIYINYCSFLAPQTLIFIYTHFFHQFTSLLKTTLIPSHQPNKKGNLLEIAGGSSSIKKSKKKTPLQQSYSVTCPESIFQLLKMCGYTLKASVSAIFYLSVKIQLFFFSTTFTTGQSHHNKIASNHKGIGNCIKLHKTEIDVFLQQDLE